MTLRLHGIQNQAILFLQSFQLIRALTIIVRVEMSKVTKPIK